MAEPLLQSLQVLDEETPAGIAIRRRGLFQVGMAVGAFAMSLFTYGLTFVTFGDGELAALGRLAHWPFAILGLILLVQFLQQRFGPRIRFDTASRTVQFGTQLVPARSLGPIEARAMQIMSTATYSVATMVEGRRKTLVEGHTEGYRADIERVAARLETWRGGTPADSTSPVPESEARRILALSLLAMGAIIGGAAVIWAPSWGLSSGDLHIPFWAIGAWIGTLGLLEAQPIVTLRPFTGDIERLRTAVAVVTLGLYAALGALL